MDPKKDRLVTERLVLRRLKKEDAEATRNSDDVNLDKEIEQLKTQYQLVKEKYFEYLNK